MNNEEKILTKLDGMEKRFDGVEKRLDGVEKSLNVVTKRLNTMSDVMGTTATKSDLVKMESNIREDMATKDDLHKLEVKVAMSLIGLENRMTEKMATKEDLKKVEIRLTSVESHMATKEEVTKISAKMATKEDLTKIAHIQDKLVKQGLNILVRLENAATKEDLKFHKERVINHVDGFAKNQEIFDAELTSLRARYDQHETRLGHLEPKMAI